MAIGISLFGCSCSPSGMGGSNFETKKPNKEPPKKLNIKHIQTEIQDE